MIVVAVSGGFDPLHAGHIDYLEEAKQLGDYLVVILNSDEWVLRKRGILCSTYDHRERVLKAIKFVDEVVPAIDEGDTVAESLAFYKPDKFAKGGDRDADNMPQQELEVCANLGIEIIYDVGGYKYESSSWIINRILRQGEKHGNR